MGKGAPLCLKKDSNVEFDAKADGANRFLKKKVPKVPILGQTEAQTDFEVILANSTGY